MIYFFLLIIALKKKNTNSLYATARINVDTADHIVTEQVMKVFGQLFVLYLFLLFHSAHLFAFALENVFKTTYLFIYF